MTLFFPIQSNVGIAYLSQLLPVPLSYIFPLMASRNAGQKTISEKETKCILTIRKNVVYRLRTRHERRTSVYQIQIKLSIIIVMKTTSIAAKAALLLLPVCCCAVQMVHVA